jgi:hypothetical protein
LTGSDDDSGQKPGGIIRFDGPLSEAECDEFVERWHRLYHGLFLDHQDREKTGVTLRNLARDHGSDLRLCANAYKIEALNPARPPRLTVWRHGYPRIIARLVRAEFRQHGARGGLRMARRALWLLFVVPFRSWGRHRDAPRRKIA